MGCDQDFLPGAVSGKKPLHNGGHLQILDNTVAGDHPLKLAHVYRGISCIVLRRIPALTCLDTCGRLVFDGERRIRKSRFESHRALGVDP